MQITTSHLSSTIPKRQLNDCSRALIETLLYFDIFNYPLRIDELVEFCQGYRIDKTTAEAELAYLLEKKMIQKEDDFFIISTDRSIVNRRKIGNELAQIKMKLALKMSDFISRFPFVRCVCISGSLSKNFMSKDSDIDFFIITSPNRLWLCRGLLVLYKKVFLFNSHKHFCINYYLDTKTLEIPDHNLFTATEISFLKPTYNPSVFEEFMHKNSWTQCYYPNKPKEQFYSNKPPSGIKNALEKLLNGRLSEQLDALFFRLTLRRWKKKFTHFNQEEFDLNLRSRKNVSKHHPRGYQKIVLESFEKKKSDFEIQYNVKLL